MVTNKKPTGRALSMPAGLAFGVGVSIVITILAAALLAWMMNKEMIGQDNIGYGIMALLLAASFLGSICAYSKVKRQRMVVCIITGAIYFALLISTTALFFGGQYSGVGVTALLIAGASIAAGLAGLRPETGKKKSKFKVPTR